MKEQEKEIRFSLSATFVDGRSVYMSDTLDSLLECLEKWYDLLQSVYLQRF